MNNSEGTTVVIAGATGFIGRALVEQCIQRGLRVVAIVRDAERARRVLGGGGGDAIALLTWKDDLGRAVAAADTVINLCGENVAAGRWTAKRKAILRSSRLGPTTQLVRAIAAAPVAPRVLINASAVGYYGNRDLETLTEDSSKGSGFLADLCAEWEEAAQGAEPYCRVVRLRLGVVLGAGGGMLGKLGPIVATVGAIIPGSGRQWLSWVALTDVLRVIEWVRTHGMMTGPLNVTSPEPVPMADFMRVLAHQYRRPVWGRLPEPLLRLALGQMATTLTDSIRAVPARLMAEGFSFDAVDLASALRAAGVPGR
ncbi:MAG: epimerase [Candidatus Kapaibacterium sp.]|nr:MAG: epimerase [Candidatus Kapabacteria bacterium]